MSCSYRYRGDWSDRPRQQQHRRRAAHRSPAEAAATPPSRLAPLSTSCAAKPTTPAAACTRTTRPSTACCAMAYRSRSRRASSPRPSTSSTGEHPEKNDFVIAEEVTLRGDHERRPDLVLYVNGIAVAVHRAQALLGLHRRRHPPEHLQPAARSSTSGSSAPSSSSLPATTPRACATARSAPRRNIT